MWWTQCFVCISILANLQDAQSESFNLEEYLKTGLKEEVAGMFSHCDKIENDEHAKQKWDNLVEAEISKIAKAVVKMFYNEKEILQDFGDKESVIEYLQQSGSLGAINNDMAESYAQLSDYCGEQTGSDVAPRSAKNEAIKTAVKDVQSESLNLEEYLKTSLKEKVAGMVSDCDIVKNDEHAKQKWDNLVKAETFKVVQTVLKMLYNEENTLPDLGDGAAVIEYFQRAGSMEGLKNAIAEVHAVLKGFCNEKTRSDVAPRILYENKKVENNLALEVVTAVKDVLELLKFKRPIVQLNNYK